MLPIVYLAVGIVFLTDSLTKHGHRSQYICCFFWLRKKLNDIRARFVGCQTSEFHPCGGLYFGRDHFYFVGWQRYAMGDPNLIDTLTMVSNKSIEYLSNHIPGFVVSE
jgi:hypothetical protein